MREFELLRNEIVLQAIKDYKSALCAGNKLSLDEIKSFFNSDYYIAISNIDGNEVLKVLNKKYKLELIECARKLSAYCESMDHCADCIFGDLKETNEGLVYCLLNDTPYNYQTELFDINKGGDS